MTTRPRAVPGETYLSTWNDVKFFLSAPDGTAACWASLAAFCGYGVVHLTTCRLVLELHPRPPRPALHTLSIPLVWLRRDRLHIRRPFFDAAHLSGVLVPADLTPIHLLPVDLPVSPSHTQTRTQTQTQTQTHTSAHANTHTRPHPLADVFAAHHKPMHFRIEMLDPARNDALCLALRDLLADPDQVARHTRVLRDAVDSALVPTHVHFAFVDPRDPAFLHLAVQMAPPSPPSSPPPSP